MRIRGLWKDLRSSKELLIRFAGLLTSGLFSALCLSLLASQRISWISGDAIVFILLFIQWQTLALTICKFGIDQVIFAVESRDTSLRLDITHFVWTRVLVPAFFISLVVAYVFSPFSALIAFASVILDIFSLATSAELNARRKLVSTTIANLLNYPLFFVLTFSLTWFVTDVNGILSVFLLSSVGRSYWLFTRNRKSDSTNKMRFTAAKSMAMQQVANYAAYRSDQLILPLMVTFASVHLASQEEYVFLAKYPEFVSSGVVLLGVILLPTLVGGVSFDRSKFRLRMSTRHGLLFGAVSLGVIVAFGAYQLVWQDDGDTDKLWIHGLPFLASALLVLPVHAVSYLLLSYGYVSTMIRNLSLGLILGLVVSLASFLTFNVWILSMVVPIQLVIFLMATFVLPMLKPSSVVSVGDHEKIGSVRPA